MNGHHQECFGSTNTNRHVAAFDFAAVSGCDKVVVGPTNARGGTLSLDLLTDVAGQLLVTVVAHIGITQITPPRRQSFRWLKLFQTCLLVGKFSLKIKLILILFAVPCGICPGVTLGLRIIRLRF